MNARDLLDRRAETGTARGAAAVWASAQTSNPATHSHRARWTTMGFRAALTLWIIGLVAMVVVRPSPTDSSRTSSGVTSQDELVPVNSDERPDDLEPLESNEPLPAPLLVDGGSLKRDRGGVSRPFDPNFDGDDILDSIFPDTQPPDISNDSPERSTSTVIFADPSDPFGGVILGLELLDGGGFRPWAANLGGMALTDLTQQLEQVDGNWSIADDSGLIEVARFQDDFFNSLKFGWQFDFQLAGADEITIQTESTEAGNAVNEWLWIARLAGPERSDVSVNPIQVLGQSGYVVDMDDRSGNNGVIWSSEGFVYRMTATRLENDVYIGRDSTEDIGRLRVASRREWVDAIAVSVRTSPTEWVVGISGLLVLAALLASTIFFLVKQSFRAAALAAITFTSWVFLAGSPTYSGTVALTVLGLGLAWWLHRTSSSAAAQVPPGE